MQAEVEAVFTAGESYNSVIRGQIGPSGSRFRAMVAETRITLQQWECVVEDVETDVVDVYRFGELQWMTTEQAVPGTELRIDPVPYVTENDASFLASIDLADPECVEQAMNVFARLSPRSVIVVVAKNANITDSITCEDNAHLSIKPVGEFRHRLRPVSEEYGWMSATTE